ncbi:reversion-inducing cysteine-rich protein with Kazal motifs-like [Glandiceps talaboti]
MNIRTIISILLVAGVQTQEPRCCHNVNSRPECQEVCDQMALESTQSGRQRHFARLRSNCPMTLETFWQCVNATAPAIWMEDTRWFGQRCCSESRQDECRHACQQAHTKSDLSNSCLPDIEETLMICLTKYERQQHCCNQAPIGSQCWSKCQSMFEMDYPSSEDEITMHNYCVREENLPEVVVCVNNYTASLPVKDPTESLHCCDFAGDDECREACQHVLRTMVKDSDIMDGLTEKCGLPLPQNPLWQCFIWNSGNTDLNDDAVLGNVALDGAQLQCCSKAVTIECRDLCRKLHTTRLDDWNEFDTRCQYQPKETELLRCIADVQEPCELGCTGLTYCQNFNGRPTEFFRSCTSRSDQGAEDDMSLWQEGTIDLRFLETKIQVLDIRQCQPDMWKAIACALQIKPCHSKSHANLICKSDCISILSDCLDHSRHDAYQTPESLCTMMSPSDDSAPCLSLQNYLAPSTRDERMHEVNVPCHSNPCSNETAGLHQLCQINRHTCDYTDVCYDHSCASGCKLGEASKFLVPQGSYVQIPDLDSIQPGCFKVCQCGSNNLLEDCDFVLCVDTSLKCKEGGQIKDHHTHFHVDCNICSCYSGELICSLRQCISDESTDEERRRYTGLPCDSPDELIPVCGINGRTYPNAHIARCVGLTDNEFEIGSCSSKDPCDSSPCPGGQQCVPKRHTCLGTTVCTQYVCVSSSVSCAGEAHEPVCDKDGREHPNICTLYRRGKHLSYRGRCQRACNEELAVTVCGQNGETFSSKCTAWSQRVTIDYNGPCQAVGFLSDDNDTARCATVKCPKWDIASCNGIVPPGACCPICAGQLRILYSTFVSDEVAAILKQPVSLETVLIELRRHISVAECDLYGYLSIEADVVVLVVPIVANPTNLQVDACNKETLKLEALINSGSPLVSSFVHLSLLTAAFATTSEIQTVSSSPNLQNPYFIVILQSSLLVCFYFLHWKR